MSRIERARARGRTQEAGLNALRNAPERTASGVDDDRPTLFGRGYWPAGASSPASRVLLALAAAPLIVTLGFVAIAALVYWRTEPSLDAAIALTQETAVIFALGAYALAWTGCLAAFLALWALRIRRRTNFALAGATVGVIAAGVGWAAAGATSPARVIGLALVCATLMLTIRWLAGVRKVGRPGRG